MTEVLLRNHENQTLDRYHSLRYHPAQLYRALSNKLREQPDVVKLVITCIQHNSFTTELGVEKFNNLTEVEFKRLIDSLAGIKNFTPEGKNRFTERSQP